MNPIHRLVFYIFVSLIVSFNIYLSYEIFPLFGTDSGAFIPTAVELHNTGNLSNHLYSKSESLDKENKYRFLYYVPLFPITVSLSMYTSLPKTK